MEELERKFSYPEEAAILDSMMGKWLHYHPATDVKSANISIANGYHEAIWRFLHEHIEEARGAPKEVISEITQAMINTGINRAFDLITFLCCTYTEWAKELVIKVAEAVFTSQHPQSSYQTFLILSEINNLPDELIKKGMTVNQRRGFIFLTPTANKEMIALLNANLTFWLIEKIRYRGNDQKLYSLKSGIPIFAQSAWEVLEQTDSGVLLSAWEQTGERFLLHGGKATKIPEKVMTVATALASIEEQK